jgi:hypothetical protein
VARRSVVLLAVGGLATVGTQDTWLDGYGIIAYGLVPRQRWTIAIAMVGLGLMPSIFADTNYDLHAPRQTNAPAIRGLFSRVGSTLALVRPGAQAPAMCCSTILNRDEIMAMPTGEETRRDLLVLLPVDAGSRITDLHIQLVGENGLQVTTPGGRAADDLSHQLEQRTYRNDLGPVDAAGRRIVTGWVARVPVILNPTKPLDIGGNRYPLTVKASFRIAGDAAPHASIARAAAPTPITSARSRPPAQPHA